MSVLRAAGEQVAPACTSCTFLPVRLYWKSRLDLPLCAQLRLLLFSYWTCLNGPHSTSCLFFIVPTPLGFRPPSSHPKLHL